MTGVYWRAARPRPVALWLVALVAVCAIATTEVVQAVRVLPGYTEKLAAARLCGRAFDVLREERLRRGLGIDVELDPTRSGLIGALLTPITTEAGRLSAKQTSINRHNHISTSAAAVTTKPATAAAALTRGTVRRHSRCIIACGMGRLVQDS